MSTAVSAKKRSLLPFFIATAISSAASNAAHPVTPTMFINLGFADYMFGVALAANLLTNFLFSPFWGKLNDYISSRKMLGAGLLGYSFAQVLFCFATSEWQIIVARLVCGVFVGAWFVGQLTYLVNYSSDSLERGRNLTLNATVNSVALPFGYMLGGLVGDHGVKLAILMQIGMLLVSGAIYYFGCDDDNKMTLAQVDRKTLLKEGNPFASFAAAREFLTPLFLGMFVMALLQNCAQTMFDQSFNYFTKEQFGFSSGNTGLVKGGIGLITLFANMVICTRLIKKTDIRKTVIPVLVICALSMAGVAGIPQVVPFIGTIVILYAASAISVPMLQNIVANHGNNRGASGLVMGFYNSMKYLGGLFGALGSGFLYDVYPRLPFITAAVIFCASAGLAFICWRKDLKVSGAWRG